MLRAHLGVTTIIWLDEGVFDDETDGHADHLVRFVAPGRVVLTWTDDPDDPQHAISPGVFERLSKARDARGRALEIIKVHHPGPLYMTEAEAKGIDVVEGTEPRVAGLRLAASFVNFCFCNGALIMPALDPGRDEAAANAPRGACPNHTIILVDAREILPGGGNFHGITQQQPAGPMG